VAAAGAPATGLSGGKWLVAGSIRQREEAEKEEAGEKGGFTGSGSRGSRGKKICVYFFVCLYLLDGVFYSWASLLLTPFVCSLVA